MGQAAFLRVFSQENTCRNPRNRTGNESQKNKVNRIKEHVSQSLRAKGEHFTCHTADPVDDDVQDEGDKQDDGKGCPCDENAGHALIFSLFCFNTDHISFCLLLNRKRH